MELSLQQFTGGLNTWMDPMVVPPSDAVTLINADLSRGVIEPLLGQVTTSQPGEMAFLSATRSVVKWNNQHFWTDNDTGLMESSLGYVGITPPSSSPGLSLGLVGSRFVGSYRYLCTFITDDGWESAPIFALGENNVPWTAINCTHESVTLTSANYPAWSQKHQPAVGYYGYNKGDRVSAGGRDYECVQKYWVATRLGLAKHLAPAAAGPNYWKDITGVTITSTGYDSVSIVLPQPSEAVATSINIYRTIKDGSEFYLVKAVPSGTASYKDTMEDAELLLSNSYTITYQYPPVYAFVNGVLTRQLVKYLLELNGIFYLAVGDKVFMSEQSNPHVWDPLKFVPFNFTVTGLARAGDSGVLVFTQNQTYLLIGTTLQDMVKIDLQVGQGCANWRTICYMQNSPLWMSNDGLCAYRPYEGREGKAVQLLLQGKIKWPEIPAHSCASADIYYGFLSNGTALRVDFKQGMRPDTMTADAEYAYYDPDNDRLVIAKSGAFYSLLEGDPLTWTYETPDLTTQDFSALKHFRRMCIEADGAISIGITTDGVFQRTITSSAVGKRWVFLPQGLQAERIRFTLSGQTILRGIKVELFGG